MDGGQTIGTYSTTPSQADFDELVAAGGSEAYFDVLGPIGPKTADLMTMADEIATAARSTPVATAAFYGQPVGPAKDGEKTLVLQVVGGGTKKVQFQLEPLECAVLFQNLGEPVGWREFPEIETGFITPDADGLGGLGRRAVVAPGAYGAIIVKTLLPTPVTSAAFQLSGTLYEGLPDELVGSRFAVRTEPFEL